MRISCCVFGWIIGGFGRGGFSKSLGGQVRVQPRFLGERCLNQDFQDKRIVRKRRRADSCSVNLLKVSCIGVGNESLSTKKPSSSSVERADRNDPIFADAPLDADVLMADQLIFCIGAPMEDKSAKESSKGMVGCATAERPEGTRAPVVNALPLRNMSAILLNIQEKMSALSAFTPPPPFRLLYEGKRLFCVCGGWRWWQAARGWLCLTDAQRYYNTLQFWQVAGSAGGCGPKWG